MHDPENYLIAKLILSHVAVAIVAFYGGMVFGTNQERLATKIREQRTMERLKREADAKAFFVLSIVDKGHQIAQRRYSVD